MQPEAPTTVAVTEDVLPGAGTRGGHHSEEVGDWDGRHPRWSPTLVIQGSHKVPPTNVVFITTPASQLFDSGQSRVNHLMKIINNIINNLRCSHHQRRDAVNESQVNNTQEVYKAPEAEVPFIKQGRASFYPKYKG